MPPVFTAAVALPFGLVIGSFLNVVAYRLPRSESLATPASRCPSCGTPIRPYDNIPVLSWLLLRGRCRGCGEAISPRYPLVELGTGLLYLTVVLAKDGASEIVLGLLLVTLLVPITLIDLDQRIIPNKLVVPGSVAALLTGLLLDPSFVPEQLIAGAAAFSFFFLAAMAYPKGIGMLGLYLGRAVAPAIFIALVAGVAVGAAIIVRVGSKQGRKTAVPFGPFLALGGIVAFFAGTPLVDAYLNHF